MVIFRHSSKGMTIMEIMIVLVLFMISLNMLLSVMQHGQNLGVVIQKRTELRQQLNIALEKIAHDMRSAGDSSILNVPADGAEYNSIRFLLPSGISSNQIAWGTNEIQYYLAGTNLIRQEGATVRTVARSIYDIDFLRNSSSPGLLKVSVAALDIRHGAQIIEEMDMWIALRNN